MTITCQLQTFFIHFQAHAEHPTVFSLPGDSGIPLRPLTPSFHRAGGDFIHSQEQNNSNRITDDGENINVLMSSSSTVSIPVYMLASILLTKY